MSFLTLFALAVGLLVAAPVAAHLLRRRRTEERPFPAAKLIPATQPTARRRSMLEDRGLFALRALSILVLAVLGATPFVSCSHIALERKGGASVALAIVIDDSLSMRAPFDGKETRFDRAKRAAVELLQSSRSGDSITIVLAGAPPRVAIATTTDLPSVKAACDELAPSDRATDLEGAIHLALDLVKTTPQADKRVVLLSDLADGNPTAPALSGEGEVTLWQPLPELAAKGEADCGIVSAERSEGRVVVRMACTEGATVVGRSIGIDAKGKTIASVTPKTGVESVSIDLPKDAADDLVATLSPGDTIATDDRAPVGTSGTSLGIGVFADSSQNRLETGGPPPIEQAFGALELGSLVKPLAGVPEHEDDLKALAGLILDDPPGLTPESRRGIAAWVESGGELLVTLGRSASNAPLGAGFGGLFPGVVRWGASPSEGAAPDKCTFLGSAAEGLTSLHPQGRTILDHTVTDDADVLCAFQDGAPLLVRRRLGRGTVIISTLPFNVTESDLALRPAFLTLLDRFTDEARARGGTRHVEVGQSFTFAGVKKVEGELSAADGSPPTPVTVGERDGLLRAVAEVTGSYRFKLDGVAETRVATVSAREIDLRPRAVAASARASALGGKTPRVDASPYVALFLLALISLELGLRAYGVQKAKPASV